MRFPVPWVPNWPNGPGVAVKAPCPLTIGFGARGAAEDEKALQVDLTHDKRRQSLKGVRRAEYTRRVAQRDVTKTSIAWETPRGANLETVVRRSATAKRPPEGNKG